MLVCTLPGKSLPLLRLPNPIEPRSKSLLIRYLHKKKFIWMGGRQHTLFLGLFRVYPLSLLYAVVGHTIGSLPLCPHNRLVQKARTKQRRIHLCWQNEEQGRYRHASGKHTPLTTDLPPQTWCVMLWQNFEPPIPRKHPTVKPTLLNYLIPIW